MSIKYGFYNSVGGDRKYDALQMSSLFDGVINDGVYATIGGVFAVTAAGGLNLNVATGKAWFNHTWTENDSILLLTAMPSEVILDRIDAVVIEIDSSQSVRANDIKIITGQPASTPTEPIMADTETLHQYPLCYIYRKSGTTDIKQSDITNMVGSSFCPYVTALLEVHNIDNIVAQWRSQWVEWFTTIRNTLGDDVATNLAMQIIELQKDTLVFRDVEVPASSWTPDDTYYAYHYVSNVYIPGCTEEYVPEVIFDYDDAMTETLAPFAIASSDVVRIYSKQPVEKSINISIVKISR